MLLFFTNNDFECLQLYLAIKALKVTKLVCCERVFQYTLDTYLVANDASFKLLLGLMQKNTSSSTSRYLYLLFLQQEYSISKMIVFC